MAKSPTDSDTGESQGYPHTIRINISNWLKQALNQIVQQSDANAREAIRRPLEYAIIEWNREFERDNEAFDIPGSPIQNSDFRCIECKSANKFLFRELQTEDESSEILCLNCEHTMSNEEVTRLARAAQIQTMEPYTLEKEGVQIRHEYEGEYRTPIRFECQECKERDLILPDPDKVDCLICPRCGNKGHTLDQVQGPAVSGFRRYSPEEYHEESGSDSVGRGISRGQYDELEKTYKDGHER